MFELEGGLSITVRLNRYERRKMKKIKSILVPFGYPDYPQDVVSRFISESERMLKSLDIELKTTKAVINPDDAPPVAREIRRSEFDLIIALLVSWVEAPNVIATLRDFFTRPILLWSHTTYLEDGVRITLGPMPAAGVLRETFEEMGVNFKFVYGMPDSDKVKEGINSYAKAARAARFLQRSRVGLFGYYSMGMYTGAFDHTKLRRMLGPEIIHLDQYLIVRGAEDVKEERVKGFSEKARSEWELSEEVRDNDIATVMKLYLALKALVAEHKLNALTVKCQYELSREYGVAPCIPLSMLGDEMPCSCEGDVPLILSQLILHHLTGGGVTSYGDVHDILDDNGIILAACGFAPLSLAQGRPRVSRHTALYEGLLNMSPYKEGRVTLARLASDKEGYKMHIATGFASAPPPFHEIGCPPYAGMKVVLDGDADAFISSLFSQHYALVYEDVRRELEELCDLLGIRKVIS
jgi:L-fucose isomerase-like protein